MIKLRNINWREFNIRSFIEGCHFSFLIDWNAAPEMVTKVSKYRLSICEDCKMNANNWCDNSGNVTITHVETGKEVIGCGCNLNCKSASFKEECPAGKWKRVEKPAS